MIITNIFPNLINWDSKDDLWAFTSKIKHGVEWKSTNITLLKERYCRKFEQYHKLKIGLYNPLEIMSFSSLPSLTTPSKCPYSFSVWGNMQGFWSHTEWLHEAKTVWLREAEHSGFEAAQCGFWSRTVWPLKPNGNSNETTLYFTSAYSSRNMPSNKLLLSFAFFRHFVWQKLITSATRWN